MTTLGVPFGAASPTSVRVDLPIHAFVVEAMAKPPVALYVKPVQGGESLASDISGGVVPFAISCE